jgi:hypothetical protein
MDCSHGIPRTKGMATFFEEDNLRPCCHECNRTKGGNYEVFKRNLDAELGEGAYENLLQKSRATVKISRGELVEKIEYYRAKNKEL